MGWLRKKIKQLGRGIKKVGKKIGKAFKKVLKPFAKIFNKLGPIGTIALSMFLPGIGTAIAGWGAGMGNVVGTMIKFVGNAINYVATAPQKIFGTITDAIGASWNTLTGATTGTWKPGSWFDNFSKQMNDRIAGDGWFGGKSGSWSSFDTTGGILPSGANFTEGGVSFDEATNKWMEVGADGTIGKPLSKANLEFMNAQTISAVPVSDGSVIFDEATNTWKDGVTGKELKLDRSGKPIALEAGATDSTTLLGKVRGKASTFRKKHDDKFWAAQTGWNAFQTWEQYAPSEDDPYGIGRYEPTYEWTDQGGLFNTSAPTWDFNYSTSLMANQQSANNAWNTNYGFPQGFDPSATPGYGWTYEQWLQSMGFAPIRY